MPRSTRIWKAALNGMERTTQSSDKLLRKRRKNCFLSWHHPALHICLIVWPLENGAGNIMVQYGLHNFSRAFILFCEMTFTYNVFHALFPWDVWSNVFFYPLLFACVFVQECTMVTSWFVAAGFHAFMFVLTHRSSHYQYVRARLWRQTVPLSSRRVHG